MPQTHRTKVLIIGSGPAGYTAAIYATRANLSPILVRGMQPGGQLSITTDVENFPGFEKAIQGPWLMEQMYKQCEHIGTLILEDLIVDIDLSKRPFVAKGDSGDSYIADTVVICTGAQARWVSRAKTNSAAAAFRPAPPATASSSAARRSRSSAAATPRPRKRSTSPIMPAR